MCCHWSHNLTPLDGVRANPPRRPFAELVVTNMTRRICMLIREEYQTALSNHLDDSVSSPASELPTPLSSFPNSSSLNDGNVVTPSLNRATSSFFPERDSGDILGRTSDGPLGSIFNLLGHSKAAPSGEGASRSALTSFGLGSPSSAAATAPPSPSSSAVPSPESSQILQRPNPFASRDSNFASYDSSNPYGSSPTSRREEDDFSKKSFSLKPVFIEAIAELMDEVETTYRSVGEQSLEHIHSGSVCSR